ncbi:hypothetical protein [Marinithermus hydrothermalis]|uniref:Outer membrane protein beta-barrel domain-containing protein n=1 Tax=Marinithermus hydrothermalis (strain DSM 14884 / JCM 11576 / T1) TaxID=869210 RepID=F2NK77_MARHT|nr:hypothetical protein [Marinithermus hydrothermalis]AEB12048.1 hypothetical protein Marky_1311 [Marinithermus hydrothermalis DSM 14884]
MKHMKRWIACLTVLFGWALATGLDLGFSVRNGPNGVFMGSAGIAADLADLSVRGALVLGAPEGLLVSGEVLYTLPGFVLYPYLGGGVALGLTARAEQNALTLAIGERIYALATAGVAFPERGYRPYLELTQYLGPEPFTRVTVGFVMEAF